MKTIFKNIFYTSAVLSIFSVASFVYAEDLSFNKKDLAISFPTFDFFKFNNEKDDGDIGATTTDESDFETLAIVEIKKESCEHFDSTSSNLLTLESASADARQKIENVDETIDEEVSVRENIFDSVKGLLGLQKKDRVIFREMKNDIKDAKNYYDELDLTVASTSVYLSENICENVEVIEAKKVDIETGDLVEDEITFRKQFAVSLKEKMKILQTEVKEAKK